MMVRARYIYRKFVTTLMTRPAGQGLLERGTTMILSLISIFSTVHSIGVSLLPIAEEQSDILTLADGLSERI